MEKVVEIGSEKLVLRSSLYSLINYRNRFGSELFNDIKKIEEVKENNITEVLEVIFRIVFILTNPKDGETFDDFLKRFDLGILSDVSLLQRLSNAIVELLKTDNKGNKGETFRSEKYMVKKVEIEEQVKQISIGFLFRKEVLWQRL